MFSYAQGYPFLIATRITARGELKEQDAAPIASLLAASDVKEDTMGEIEYGPERRYNTSTNEKDGD